MKAIDIIGRCKQAFGVTTQTALAKKLDLTPSSVTDALRRGEIPEVWIYKVAYQTGRRVEWLRSGERPEFSDAVAESQDRYKRTRSPALEILLEERAKLTDTEQRLVDAAMKVLLSADAPTRAVVVEMMELVYEKLQLPHQQRRAAPPKKATGSV